MSKGTTQYITTTLPYVNANPHMGHALEFVRADIIARWRKFLGEEVFFNTGTDEHGQKISTAAEASGVEIQSYVDKYANEFKNLLPLLNISPDIHFIRTTDKSHEKAAQEFWKRVDEAGYIYKKNYKTKYCIGCEAEKTDSEISDGKCIIHPNLEIEVREEENYFFKFSAFSEKLLKLYESDFIIPESRQNETREFVKRGLEDFSISRLREKMSWGVSVPNDEDHVMYVWFDALVNYISTLGWPDNKESFKKFWVEGRPIQYCGKDNTRFQGAMWQAMLMAAGLPNSYKIVVNGFVTGENGVKMSKSLGNVVDPIEITKEYGADALRYFVAREISTFEDSPFTLERFKEAYNANLANGIGNLTSRIMKLAETYLDKPVSTEHKVIHGTIFNALEKFEIGKAMDHIWWEIGELDSFIQENKPWVSKDTSVISEIVTKLSHIGHSLEAFMPETAKKIINAIEVNKMPEPIFLRKD
ncbi:MAG: methionine--tRNA ligase [Minisyncoccota bacterium]